MLKTGRKHFHLMIGCWSHYYNDAKQLIVLLYRSFLLKILSDTIMLRYSFVTMGELSNIACYS